MTIKLLPLGRGCLRHLSLCKKIAPDIPLVVSVWGSDGQDISATAIELARQRHLPNVTLHCGPLDSMDLQENSFDLVVCNRVLQHISKDDLGQVLDIVAKAGKFAYINECLPEQDMAECWYLKKYDLQKMLEDRHMELVSRLQIDKVEMAMVFRKIS